MVHEVAREGGDEELVEGEDELRMSVERMTKRRLVKIKAPATQPATQPTGGIIKRLLKPPSQ